MRPGGGQAGGGCVAQPLPLPLPPSAWSGRWAEWEWWWNRRHIEATDIQPRPSFPASPCPNPPAPSPASPRKVNNRHGCWVENMSQPPGPLAPSAFPEALTPLSQLPLHFIHFTLFIVPLLHCVPGPHLAHCCAFVDPHIPIHSPLHVLVSQPPHYIP